MAVKVDLYLAREWKGIWCRDYCWEGWTWWWEVCWAERETGNIEEGPQPNSVAMVAEKKKLQELKKKSYAEAKKLKKMQKANR